MTTSAGAGGVVHIYVLALCPSSNQPVGVRVVGFMSPQISSTKFFSLISRSNGSRCKGIYAVIGIPRITSCEWSPLDRPSVPWAIILRPLT
eukprot:scaffold16214_cov29-Attheya_sp.AAC.4